MENPLLNEVLPLLNKWLEDAGYYNRGFRFGTLELRFGEAGTAHAASLNMIETDKWIIYPIYKSGRLLQARIIRIPPEIKAEWIISAVLANVEAPFNIITISQIVTPNLWGFGLNVKAQLTDKNGKTLSDEITFLDGRRLNVLVGEKCLFVTGITFGSM